MPRNFMFTKEEVVAAALELARESGMEAVTARSLGAKLKSSSKPIFSLFRNMEEVQRAVIEAASKLYQSYLREDMESGIYPPYKASGMAYIRFAGEEKELFKLLFMRERSREENMQGEAELAPIIAIVRKNTGLGEEEAKLFHLEMWMFTHGIATTIATSYFEWDMELISRILTDGYEGIKYRHCGKGRTDGCD